MNELTRNLRKTPARDVHVKLHQVIELIGEEKAQALSHFTVGKSEAKETVVGVRSAIPPEKRINTEQLARFNRDELLEAINEAKGKDFQNDEEPSRYTATPNKAIIPRSHAKKLTEHGY